MFFYTKEFDIKTFNFWGSAKWIQSPDFTEDQLSIMETYLDDCFHSQYPSATDINDYVAFYFRDTIKQLQLFGDYFDYSQL